MSVIILHGPAIDEMSPARRQEIAEAASTLLGVSALVRQVDVTNARSPETGSEEDSAVPASFRDTNRGDQQEKESAPYSHFNLNAMSDDQIIVLHRGLWSLSNLSSVLGEGENDAFDQPSIGDQLGEVFFIKDANNLALHDPGRVKNLLEGCASSDVAADHALVARVVGSLVDYDYAFTTQTLLTLLTDPETGRRSWDDVADTVQDAVRFLMRDHMTPDQIVAFNQELVLRHGASEPLIYPALPSER